MSVVSEGVPAEMRIVTDGRHDELPWSVSHYLAALALIAVVFLAALTVLLYCTGSSVKKQVTRVDGLAWMLWFVVALVITVVVSSGLGLLALGALQRVERSKLFVPTTVSRYSRVSGKWYPLPGGGGLMHCTPNADPRARPVLFAHGNTLGLDPYASALDRFATCGYNIWAVEYAGGYGMTEPRDDAPCGDSLVRDIREAWAICGRDDAILIGFSLGGALVGQVYDDLRPAPAQVVLLNTFWSVPQLVADKVADQVQYISSRTLHAVLGPLLETQWVTKPPRSYTGRVVIVYSKDDSVVPPEHSAELCAIFADLKPNCIELPKGGHRWSAFCFMSSWCNSMTLLPP